MQCGESEAGVTPLSAAWWRGESRAGIVGGFGLGRGAGGAAGGRGQGAGGPPPGVGEDGHWGGFLGTGFHWFRGSI